MPGPLRILAVTCFTLALSAAGGLVFEALGIPVSWLSGGMIAVAAAALLGAPVMVPLRLRYVVFFVAGLSMGSGVTPDTLQGVAAWPLSVVGMAVTVVLVTSGCVAVLRWRGGWSRQDALLASAPGALSLIVALAEEHDADSPRIVLVQSMRVALLVLALPPFLSLFGPLGAEIAMGGRAGDFDLVQTVILMAGGLAGVVVCVLVRIPIPALLGALIGSATLHASGVVDVLVPGWLFVPALIAMGAVVGSRFRGVDRVALRRSFVDGLLSFAVALGVSLVAAAIAAELLGFSLGQTAVAFAPGGFDVMMVMAFALGLDPAYVAAHHLVRFLGLSFLMPLILSRRRN